VRTFRVFRIRALNVLEEPVVRPDGFDLAEHWRSVVSTLDERRAPYVIRIRIARNAIGWLRRLWGTRLRVIDDAERAEVELRGYSAEQAARELAPFGSLIEVIEPEEVRTRLVELGRELVRAHQA
jgi:predicted DNA-binding transcriptional regulator YafY